MKKYLSVVNFILLFVYAVYAVSPLAYDSISTHLEQADSLHRWPQKIIKVYAVDVFMSALTRDDQEADGDAPLSQDHILLRKKKALRTSALKLIQQLTITSTKHANLCPPQETGMEAFFSTATFPRCPHGYEYLHSGTSPPSA